jgi:uncharacterized FlgJ-related protein
MPYITSQNQAITADRNWLMPNNTIALVTD